MTIYKTCVRPWLFRLDPEWAHDQAIRLGALLGGIGPARRAIARHQAVEDRRLEIEVARIRFANPIGVAAGLDKNGRAVPFLESLGFGHVEIGSISARPSRGNPRPRLWRLPEAKAIQVHYGLPNEGVDVIANRLRQTSRRKVLGINLVKTNEGPEAAEASEDDILADYLTSIDAIHQLAGYLTLNLSCPNTRMGRSGFDRPDQLRALLSAISDRQIDTPIFLKIAPLLDQAGLDALLETTDEFPCVRGFHFNLPPAGAPERPGAPQGAIAGKPIASQMNACLGAMYRRMDHSRYRLISSGGVFSAEDAYRKIRLGASLVQVYTGLVYEGPGLARRILLGLRDQLDRDGFEHVEEAVGIDHHLE